LDYLQFLELELFARFGTRLEAAIEEKLQRGRLLREILKQDRLQPLPEAAHLAWLLAYGEGLLNGLEPEVAANKLNRVFAKLPTAPLKLEHAKAQWLASLQTWLNETP